MDAELVVRQESEEIERRVVKETGVEYDVFTTIQEIEKEMLEAAESLEYERAAVLRDELKELKRMTEPAESKPPKANKGCYPVSPVKSGKRKR